MTSSESPYAWSFLTLSRCASCKPMSRALYSATLLVQGSVWENARGMTWFWGEMNTTPTPATNPARGMVQDAPSKYICQTVGLTWEEHTSAVSSGSSSKRVADFDLGFSAMSPQWLVMFTHISVFFMSFMCIITI